MTFDACCLNLALILISFAANVNYTGQMHWKIALKCRILMGVIANKLSSTRHIHLA